MADKSIKLYNPQGAHRVVVVSCAPAYANPSRQLIQVAQGKSSRELSHGTAYGPYLEPELSRTFDQIVGELRSQGYSESLIALDLGELKHKDARRRARAAARLGRKRNKDAVLPLIKALDTAVDDSCTIVDALGEIGDLRARDAVRTYADRKLLSRRRSGVEALRKLDDQQALTTAYERAREYLTDTVVQALDVKDIDGMVNGAMSIPTQKVGRALDSLYELNTEHGNLAVERVLGQVTLGQPGLWRYAKSIFKRAVLRRDHAMLGFLAHQIEAEGRHSTGDKATVKSGYDGQKRSTKIFARKTQQYMRRAAWRQLRTIAHYQPGEYATAAAHAIIHYDGEDTAMPRGAYGRFATCYLLHQVLWGKSHRFELNSRNLKFRFRGSPNVKPATGVREEAYPELWDISPEAYLLLLGRGQLPEVHLFAVDAIQARHVGIIEKAPPDLLVGMLAAPYEPTVDLGIKELERRFDPHNPAWNLLGLLLATDRDSVRELGHRWLELTRSLWTADIEHTLVFLTALHPSTRALAAELTCAACAHLALPHKQALANRVLAQIRKEEKQPGDHAALVRVASEAIADELNALVTTADLLALIETGSESAKSFAGHLLKARPSALDDIGLLGVVALAQDSMHAVRQAAAALLKGAILELRQDPSALFALVESNWPDTREAAFSILRDDIDIVALGLDGLLGLCDSNRVDVQAVGEDLVRKHLDTLDALALAYRLSEHPHPFMHRFALELVEKHLKAGFVPLAKVEPLFRAILLNMWPSARDKKRVIDFLIARGLADQNQAEVSAKILGDFVRTKTKRDFERALRGLTELKLAFPEINCQVQVFGGDA
ncbi:MAG: hypothetical protein A2289_22690 [Deltaproteobacteria bacterium RIFOXYA12_FULL_58_15]|nr:MAG: hypothetical protein A2289_22690 [Deltaproteobacteria bacterium RIFOXYA12_FULL_58_15]OGR12776.1 MAG: hypothetical protein A2341_21825 [Deltaproteobacteria bacterium RIFOXYB12_FULL_58_9]